MRSRQWENEEVEGFSSQWQTQEQSLESFLLEQKTLHLITLCIQTLHHDFSKNQGLG